MVPEILAPAGSREALTAALAAGADAVYFGLDEGFNARARADNFSLSNLPQVVEEVHRAGVRAYLTLNTLIYERELALVETILASVAQAGVDALIVQDPAVALLARSVCPELELHASTQMTISSPEGAHFAADLGITRVVLPRELSVDEIARFAEATEIELEVFIMGALCMAWSGQCLSSEAWGGRSANRGQCAQACRLPYDLVVDDEVRPLGDISYLLSPKDLAGFRAVERLMDVGVHTLKIEGRQKGPDYVTAAVTSLRRWVDSLAQGAPSEGHLARDLLDLSLTYSRGFGDGFLAGSDHQSLVEGRSPRHRGVLLGVVEKVGSKKVRVGPPPNQPGAYGEVSSPLPALGGAPEAATGPRPATLEPRPGMGIVFGQGDDQEREQGGPIFRVEKAGSGWILGFGQPGPNLRRVQIGARVYVTSDPEVSKRLAAEQKKTPAGRQLLNLRVEGRCHERLTVVGSGGGQEFTVRSSSCLSSARKRSLDRSTAEEKLLALGGSPFRPGRLDFEVEDGLFLPLSELKSVRRELVEGLTERWLRSAPKAARPGPHLVRTECAPHQCEPYLVALCRNDDQLEAAIEAGLGEVELDWMELTGLNASVARARQAGLKLGLATVRVQKPGEEVYDRRLQKLEPDSLLVRHWGGLWSFSQLDSHPELHGDFCLNVTNSVSARKVLSLGLTTITASHDLDKVQLRALLDETPRGRVAVTIHHHIPTFHTEHCVYSALLSNGRDYRSCGRPCETHQVALRDRVGKVHPVIVDVGCRNTVFNAAAQSAAEIVPDLIERGVSRFRVEFVRESFEEARLVLSCYQALLRGTMTPAELVSQVKVHEQFGVTAGTMKVLD